MPAVSVVVPVYKVEPYLERCVDSLRCQTLRDIEIILVDDGSPDRCGMICDEYGKRDPRIRVIHQDNKGLSAARNVGILHASGTYIMFADSDDWAEPGYCQIPYEIAEKYSADLVIFQYFVARGKRKKPLQSKRLSEGFMTCESALFEDKDRFWTVPAWNKLFHRKLFQDIRFPEGRFFEDTGIMHRLIHESDSIYYVASCLYNYSAGRKGSITTMRSEKASDDLFEMYMQKVADLEDWGFEKEAARHRENAYSIYLTSRTEDSAHYQECAEYFTRLPEFPDYYSFRRRIILMLFRHARPLFKLGCMVSLRNLR